MAAAPAWRRRLNRALIAIPLVAGAAFIALRPLENSPLPLWDGGSVDHRGIRSATVGLLLCTAGAATLTSVAWGLKDQGLYCVAVMLAALAAARWLASTPRTAATG